MYSENFEFNKEKLKEAFTIRKDYEEGTIDLPMAQAQLKAHIGTLKPSELAYIEQEFQEKIDEECIHESLAEMTEFYKEILVKHALSTLPTGHPIQNYIDENKAIKQVITEIDKLIEKPYIKNQWDEAFEKLNAFKIHLSRKQNQLYSAMERKGFTRPTETMWIYDNVVKEEITKLLTYIKNKSSQEELPKEFFLLYKEHRAHILDLMDKENTILYPTSMDLLSKDDINAMVIGDKEIGYCLVNPPAYQQELGKSSCTTTPIQESSFMKDLSTLLAKYNLSTPTDETVLHVAEGQLTLSQINLIFKHLPVDISYVDENEIVTFYSDTKHRVFPRSKGVIGRDVKNCHPLNSVSTVEEIIQKFRSGEKDSVDFWIQKEHVFIYILYVAVRNEAGHFKGVLEMMQECSHIRNLKGNRTLLTWQGEDA